MLEKKINPKKLKKKEEKNVPYFASTSYQLFLDKKNLQLLNKILKKI